MRCLALMFVQARLVPDDHPALYYGAEGVPKTEIRDLFGEAWFTLRTTKASTYQYGIFASIIMMLVTLTAAIGAFILRVAFGLGDVAQAQIFAHPCSPYSGGAFPAGSPPPCGGPGLTEIQAGPATAVAPGGLFDSRVNDAGISADYALMVLDKILRQAASGTPGTGGTLQNALTGLMQVYNSGVTLVAAAMLFWMVVSIVIDAAKTGMFGGGRHNMVWAPIRIVFALGIMVPLGSQGFSSGQYMVMKLAEWGSNFGTQGWVAYVNGVITDDSLLSPFAANNPSTLVSTITKVMTCQVAYNAFLAEADITDARQYIEVKTDASNRTPWVRNRYTNTTGSNLCGTIVYGTAANAATEDMNLMLGGSGGGLTTPMDAASVAATGGGARTRYTNFKDGLNTAIASFRNQMMGALTADLTENNQFGDAGGDGAVITLARGLACQIVAMRYAQPGTANNPVGNIPAPWQNCGTNYTTPGNDPDATDAQAILDQMMGSIGAAYDGNASPAAAGSAKDRLLDYIQGISPAGGGMIDEMRVRGWAGMGMWYLDIAQLNGALHAAREPTVSVEPGTLWEGAGKGGFWSGLWSKVKCFGRWLFGRACTNPKIEEKVVAVLADYDRWWANVTRPGTAGRTDNATDQRNADLGDGDSGGLLDKILGAISFVKNLVTGNGQAIVEWVVNKVWGRNNSIFLFDAVDLAATNTYPLASLSHVGYSLIYWGTGVMGGLTIVQMIFSASAATFSAGGGLAISALANGIASICTTMIIAGVMIAFYLPVLPFVRVAFAVLTWMVSVFEAVVMVPIAALAHLTTEGDGLAGGARTAWILWLNVLMRPILVVFGFVAGMLIFNTFAVYFHTTFNQGAISVAAAQNNFLMVMVAQVAYSVIYLGVLYTAANTSFKLMDLFPNSLMRWMGGTADHSMDDDNDGMMLAATQLLGGMKPNFDFSKKKDDAGGPGDGDKGATKSSKKA